MVQCFEGTIDEVMIFNRALSGDEVRQLAALAGLRNKTRPYPSRPISEPPNSALPFLGPSVLSCLVREESWQTGIL